MSNTKSTLRWGVLGAAEIARKATIPAIHASVNSEVVAVASRDLARAQQFCQALQTPKAYGSYEALLADPEIDAVYIPLPHHLHCEWTVHAAQAGKHILCEKPMAMNAAEVQKMVDAVKANQVLLMESFMYRFHPKTCQIVERVRSGALGKLKYIQASLSFTLENPEDFRWHPQFGGGALMDVGCYCVNLARTVTDAEPLEVQALAAWSESGVDEHLVATLRFPAEVFVHFDCGFVLPRREAYQIVGSQGWINSPQQAIEPFMDEVFYTEEIGGEAKTHKVAGVSDYRLMIEQFARCVLDAEASPYPPEEALGNARAIEALMNSARNGGKLQSV